MGEKESRKAYKVLERCGNDTKLHSCLAKGKARVAYTPGEVNRAPKWLARQGYHLAAFATLDDLSLFYSNCSLDPFPAASKVVFEVWLVEASGITEYTSLPPFLYAPSIAGGNLRGPHDEHWRWPAGTIMCETIKPLKRVR